MFFEGCPPHLGCSVNLRGASEYELARVKEIIRLMVCVAYHSQLEISFLMDEFAMPPSLAQSTSFPCLLESVSAEETDRERQEKSAEPEDTALGGQSEDGASSTKNGEIDTLQDKQDPKSLSSMEEETGNTETVTTFPSQHAPSLPVPLPFLMEEDQEMSSDTLIRVFEGKTEEEGSIMKEESLTMEDQEGSDTPTPKLFRDPLQDDTGMFVAEQVASSDDHLKSISAVFKQELKDIILCISPFITFKKPFLLTPTGMHCPSREYFPEQVPSFVVVVIIH